jgi:hypothetical protein
MTTFVFVHGRGSRRPDLTDWRRPLYEHLASVGITPPAMDSDRWLELRYDDLLNGSTAPGALTWPDRPAVPLSSVELYAARIAALRELAVTPRQVGAFDLLNKGIREASRILLMTKGIPVTVDVQSVMVTLMTDVTRFASNEDLRMLIVQRLLDGMPDGDVVLVAHSLGTVATLEMLPYLPRTTTVRLLLTLGSPAALDQLQERAHLAGAGAPFPADRVDSWLNLVNPGDPVCLGAGLRARFSLVTDHRIRPRWSHVWEEFHGVRTYLEDPIVGHALNLALYRGQAPIPHVAQEPGGADALLPSYVSVAYAGGLAESAAESNHRARCRRILNEKLLRALSEAEGREVSWTDVELRVGAWVASGQPRSHRLTVLMHAALSDPFAPFDPGLSGEDKAAGLRQLAQRLGLGGGDAEDLGSLLAVCWRVARNEKRAGPWKKLLIGAGVTAAVAVAAPLAIGAFAAAGAAGAAAMTSGLAALGAGGMAGGLSTLAALSAGAGIIGGQLAGRTPTQLLQDENAMAQELAGRAAMVRLLRGVDEDDAQEAARMALEGLHALARELEALVGDHRTYSSSDSGAGSAANRNLERVQAVLAWLDEKAPADRRRSGRPAVPELAAEVDSDSTQAGPDKPSNGHTDAEKDCAAGPDARPRRSRARSD